MRLLYSNALKHFTEFITAVQCNIVKQSKLTLVGIALGRFARVVDNTSHTRGLAKLRLLT